MEREFARVFVTGDIHTNVEDLAERLSEAGTTKDDLVIILGDCGFFISVFNNNLERDLERQRLASALPATILCVQGNHEMPFSLMPAKKIALLGGEGYESEGIYFAENGTQLTINGRRCLVVGGACSVDKKRRIARGYPHWEQEELSNERLCEIVESVKGTDLDYVFTHTCPHSLMPVEVFLSNINQDEVSHRTEYFLQTIYKTASFRHWYCGHFHTEKTIEKLTILYHSILQII